MKVYGVYVWVPCDPKQIVCKVQPTLLKNIILNWKANVKNMCYYENNNQIMTIFQNNVKYWIPMEIMS